MNENDDACSGHQSPISGSAAPGIFIGAKSRTFIRPEKQQTPSYDGHPFPKVPFGGNVAGKGSGGYCPEQHAEQRKLVKKSGFVKPVQDLNRKDLRGGGKSSARSDRRGEFVSHDYVVSDCWGTNSDDVPVKFIEPFKESYLEDDVYTKKLKLEDEGQKKSPPYTKEFHVLTEVQKARILKVVEDVVKKLANEESAYMYQNTGGNQMPMQFSASKLICRKFSLPWVTIKVLEMVLCHIIQVVFLSEESYYQKKDDFLPVVFTYYLTLFIVLVSLVAQLGCFSYGNVQNPCYFMGVVSSCILTLITSLGLVIMLSSMQYYRSFKQILVLVFTGVLLCVLFAELCLFYVEVKNVWSLVVTTNPS